MGTPRILTTPAEDAYAYPLLLRHLLANVARQTSAEIVSGQWHLTYDALLDRVTRLATLLSERGVRAGDTVAVMDWDSHRYLECYFAIPMMGAVLQTVNVRLSPAQIEYTLRESGAVFALHHADFAPLFDAIRPNLPAIHGAIPMEEDAKADSYEALIAATAPSFRFEDFDENAIATTFHTTGTTGNPKQVFFSHRQLVLHTLALAATLANQPSGQGLRRGDVYMPMTPMFHVHAWGLPFVATMLGLKQVYPGRYDPRRLLALKERERVSFSHCVPTILRMLLDARDDGESLGPWTVIIGGSALAPALAEEAARAGLSTLVGFGMSETGPVVALARAPGLAGRNPTKPNASVGRPALASAASSAEAPGLANTGRLASRTARTSGKPGSDSSGVPASEICAMARPASIEAMTSPMRARSLCSCSDLRGVRMP